MMIQLIHKLYFFVFLSILTIKVTAQNREILFGASYYPEYTNFKNIDENISLMEKAGFNVVRMAESSWALLEPQDGVFQFNWLDSIIEKLNNKGIKVILGTPTYSVPAWMTKKHPDILAFHKWGEKFSYGGRCTHDITNSNYLFYAKRIITAMVKHYAINPAVIGYQIDNETKTNFLGSTKYYTELKGYVKNKYVSIQKLNKEWGLNYWSQTLSNWNELPSVKGTVFSGYKLELERFNQYNIYKFLKFQFDIVNLYKSKTQFVTHNFDLYEGGPNPYVNQKKIGTLLDYIGVDIYHQWQNDFTGVEISCGGDFSRALKQKKYFVIETNAQTTTINSKGLQPPVDGQLTAAFFSHIASGANMVAYWHWNTTNSGAEIFWRGILSNDEKPNRIYNEIKSIGAKLKLLQPYLSNLLPKNKVAIFYSHDSFHGIKNDAEKLGDYQKDFLAVYHGLYELNIGVDIITDVDNLNKYEVIVVPALYNSDSSTLNALIDASNSGVNLIFTAKSAISNENGTIRGGIKQPSFISEKLGAYYQEIMNVEKIKLVPYSNTNSNDSLMGIGWAELLLPTNSEVLYNYEDSNSLLNKYAAVVTKSVLKGSITYVATTLNKNGFISLFETLTKKYNWQNCQNEGMKFPLIRKVLFNEKEEKLIFYFNYSNKNIALKVSEFDLMKNLLTNELIKKDEIINIVPWGVIILKLSNL